MKKTTLMLIGICVINIAHSQTLWGLNNSRTDWRDNASLQGNAGAVSGFFQTAAPVNYPTGATSWWHLLDVRHDNPGNNYSMQFAGSFNDQDLWFRKISNNPLQGWRKVVFETNGKVGIGSDNPGGKLEIADGSAGDPIHYGSVQIVRPATQPDNNFHLSFIRYGFDVAGMGYANNSNVFGFWYAVNNQGTPLLSFLSSQKVGIGTSTPTEKLDVAGTVKAPTFLTGSITYNQNDNFTYVGRTTGHYALTWGADSWGPNPTTWLSGYGGLRFFSQGQPRMAIDINGNVGIATDNTMGYKLAVNGDAIFTRVKVKAFANWPDYVFNNDYKLPSLKELEQFIKLNKHLPGIPSARKVETEGLDIGDNQAVLLKKIEELTLYVIEQNKRIETLIKRVDEQDHKCNQGSKN